MEQITETLVQITPAAAERLSALRFQDPEGDRLGVWLAVSGVDAGRYTYDLTFRYLREAGPHDILQRSGDLTLVIPRSSADRLRGSRIDFEGDPGMGSLAIENPNRPSTVGMMLPVVPKPSPEGADHAEHAHAAHAHEAHAAAPAKSPAVGTRSSVPLSGDVAQRVAQVLDGAINPAIAAHGGHAELVGVENDTVYLRLSGGCQGCGMATVTLTQGIQAAITDAIPEVRNVVDVTDHASGTNPYFEPAKR
jgi:Fe/S biogenesis protein NfuA